MSAFDHLDYKQFLAEKIRDNAGINGYKGKLAQAAGCQRAYLSQVLTSHVHLTPDHAAGLSLFWGLISFERDYFLETVNFARAASPKLKTIIEERLGALKGNHDTVTGRVKKPRIENLQFQTLYYSSWEYSAIHIALTVAQLRTPDALAERFGLSKANALAVLMKLAQIGLAEKKGGRWFPLSIDLHLPNYSPLGVINHLNWRLRSVQDSHLPQSDGVHFTAVYSMSARDYQKIRADILALIAESREIALASKEEDVVTFCCDFARA